MILRRTLVALLCLSMFALDAAGAARAGGTLRRPSTPELGTLDPQKTPGIPERMIDLDLFEGLTTYAADGRVVPGAATAWEESADGRRWTFHLRHDAKWSNGDPLTAEDFVYTLRRLVDPATASPNAFAVAAIMNAREIEAGTERDATRLGVSAPDPHTLVGDLANRSTLLPAQLASVAFPVNRKAIEAHGDQWTRPGNIVTNGPFVLTEWTPHVRAVLRRNPLFHSADEVRLDEVDWIVTEDNATALKRYRSGELDIATPPLTDLDFARRNFPGELHQGRELMVEYLAFNLRAEPFRSNLKLRQALALAIDREALNTRVVDPAGQVSTLSYVPPLGTDYQPQTPAYAEIPEPDRLATARRLMTEAGYPPGRPLKLTAIYSTNRLVKKRLLSIASMWKQALGVELAIDNREWQNWLSALRDGNFQISWCLEASDLVDASDFLSAYRSTAGEMNNAGYRNPEYDKLVDAAGAESDPERRTSLLETAERLLLTDTPLIPLDNPESYVLVSRHVTGWRDSIIWAHPSRYLGIATAN